MYTEQTRFRMRRKVSIYLALASLLLTATCRKPFQYSLLEVRPLDRDLNIKAIEQIRQLSPKENFTLLFISDSQIGVNELKDFVSHANKTYSNDEISFVLHGGDITDFGANYEYNDYYKYTKELKFPVVATIGNHDMLGNGPEIYKQYFGPENFTFDYGVNRFIVFNSNSRERKFDGKTPDLDWIAEEINKADDIPTVRNIFYLSHVPPSSDDFDPDLIPGFSRLLSSTPKARLSMNGHVHSFNLSEPFEDGLTYVTTPAIHSRSYVKIYIEGEHVTVHNIFY